MYIFARYLKMPSFLPPAPPPTMIITQPCGRLQVISCCQSIYKNERTEVEVSLFSRRISSVHTVPAFLSPAALQVYCNLSNSSSLAP